MEEHDIHNVFELAKHNELQNLQWKVEYLRNEVNMLEIEKWKSNNQILKLNRMIDEFEGSLAKKRGEIPIFFSLHRIVNAIAIVHGRHLTPQYCPPQPLMLQILAIS
jgi:hypothetical protein